MTCGCQYQRKAQVGLWSGCQLRAGFGVGVDFCLRGRVASGKIV